MDAKIFVAGAAGMVGSALVRRLISMGHTDLVGSYHSRMPDASTFACGRAGEKMPEGLRLVPVDLTVQAETKRFFNQERPDHVFLAAAKVGGIHANDTFPAQFIYENLAIQNNVIHGAYQHDAKRLLFLGSSCIYPKMAPQPMKEEHLLTGLLEPTNEPYAIAKIAGIKLCESYNRQYGTRFMAVMPTNLYGPNDNFDLHNSHVLPALIRKFHLAKLAMNEDWKEIDRDEIRFGPIPRDIKTSLNTQKCAVTTWGTGFPSREFLHVDDMADACVYIMNIGDEAASSELLNYPRPCFVNLGTGVDCTIRELAESVQEIVGFEGTVVYDETKPDGTPRKLLDVSRMKNLGWRSSINLRDGIRRTYEWYRKQ